ncbi:hypothetical protein GCM10027275_05010 [Rhabdobacter roseus]|uniref:Peptidyl-prolyl cis-trans isomerase n=1 Tax=Rhabdobacter roseus TaxID=1655419 RepID=A0A840TLF2_9BACT|nr:FKBP-type peptidyl-prolyl cis-trans isomerase [Rhabdobacter roseus]MBB5282392.1 FKBP-type peptidyl-prolyl cis-trans isomerase [Rhabdobacter roseus]
MIRTYHWVVVVSLLLGAGLVGCKEVDYFTNERIAQNERDIQAYLAQQGISAQRGTDGLYYRIVSKGGTQQTAEVGNQLKVHYIISRLDGFIVDSSRISTYEPTSVIYGVERIPFLSDRAMLIAFSSLLQEGDSATLFVPHNLGLGVSGTLMFPAYSVAKVDLKVASINTEAEQMDIFTRTTGVVTQETTESGLRFGKLVSRPDSAQVEGNSTYEVRYLGRLTNGTQFDAGTFEAIPAPGAGRPVSGFIEGMLKMRIGEKAHFLFPSVLGYGTQGQPATAAGRVGIPPYAPLFFEVEILRKVK